MHLPDLLLTCDNWEFSKTWCATKGNGKHTLQSLVDVNPIKLLGYSHDIVVKSQIYAMKFVSWHSKGIVKGFS